MSQVYEAYRRPEDLGAPPSESTTMVQLTPATPGYPTWPSRP